MARRKDRMTGEKIDSKERQMEKSKRIKHTTWAHEDDAWDVKCARQSYDLSHACACHCTRKCDVWGVLFTPPVGCSRLLSLQTIWLQKKPCKVTLLSSFVKKLHNGTPRSICCSFTSSDVLDFYFFFVSSTRIRSAATMMCWMKKTTDAISDTSRKESVWVALLQTHGEDGAILLMLRWSLIGVSSVQFLEMYWERSTNSFSNLKYSSCEMR